MFFPLPIQSTLFTAAPMVDIAVLSIKTEAQFALMIEYEAEIAARIQYYEAVAEAECHRIAEQMGERHACGRESPEPYVRTPGQGVWAVACSGNVWRTR